MIKTIKDCIDACYNLNLILEVDYVILLNELETLYLDKKQLEDCLNNLEEYFAEKEDL